MGKIRVISYNCHEPYLSLLARLPNIEIALIPTETKPSWNQGARAKPPNILDFDHSPIDPSRDIVIGHNITDLLELSHLPVPKIFVIHVSLNARMKEESPALSLAAMQHSTKSYLQTHGVHTVAVSAMKKQSWNIGAQVILPAEDSDYFTGYHGTDSKLLRVVNQVHLREERFAWKDFCKITRSLPLSVIGTNPQLPDSVHTSSPEELREHYRSHRAYVHTAGKGLEDGFNMALVEAMLVGMPIISNTSAASPIKNGFNGFINSSTGELRKPAQLLLENHEKALELGANARESALKLFSLERFTTEWGQAIEIARQRFHDLPSH